MRTHKHLLRHDLKALGDFLVSNDAADANDGEEIRPRGSVRRGVASTQRAQVRTAALVALGATAVLCVLVTLMVLDTSREEPATDAGQSLTDRELVACSDGIGFGTITNVTDSNRAWKVRLSVAMEEWLKPAADARDSFNFVTASAAERGERPFEVGERILFVLQEAVSNHLVFRELRDPTSSVSAQAMGQEIEQILQRDTDTPCPSFWGR